jgi:hypothetical protein
MRGAKLSKVDNDNVVQFKLAGNVKYPEPNKAHIEQAKDYLKLVSLPLDKKEKKIWMIYAPMLIMANRFKPVYVEHFAEYCRTLSRLNDITKFLGKINQENIKIILDNYRKSKNQSNDLIQSNCNWIYASDTRNGFQLKNHPLVSQLNDDWRKIRNYVGSFGLAPCEERGINDDMFGSSEYFPEDDI